MKEENEIFVPMDALYARDLFVDLAQEYEKITIETKEDYYKVTTFNKKEEKENQ